MNLIKIIGQDPYIKINQADGLAFSVNTKTNIPPSLRNITKEIARQYNINCIPKKYSLLDWEKEGVLLLNTILTVDEGKSNSHKNIGWENFTSNIINKLSIYNEDILFMAWGKQAKEVCDLNVSGNKDRIIFSGHPSPLNTSSNKFLGCGCFGIVDDILKDKNIQPINWSSIFYK